MQIFSSKWNKRYKYLTQKSNQVQLRYANYAEKMHLDKKYNLLLKEIQERSKCDCAWWYCLRS